MPSNLCARRSNRRGLLAAAAIGGCLATGSLAQAVTSTWTGAASANWNTAGNWNGAIPSTLDIALFNAAPTVVGNGTTNPIVIDSGRTISGITFDTSLVSSYTIGDPSLNTLRLSNGGLAQMTSSVTNSQFINAPMLVNGSNGKYTFNNDSSIASAVMTINGSLAGGGSGTQGVTLGGSNTGNNTFNGVISNGTGASFAVTKAGTGTWILNKAHNYTGATVLAQGQLKLDFSAAGAPTSHITPSGSSITFGAGGTAGSNTLTLTGKLDTANTQTFNGFTMTNGAAHLNPVVSGSGTMTVNLGLVNTTTRVSGTSMDITMPAGVTVTTTTANSAAGILPQMITIGGTTFARNDGSNNIVPFTTYTANTASTLGTSNQVVDMSGGDTTISGTGSLVIGGLRFNNAGPRTITLQAPTKILNVGGGGGAILVTSNVGNNLTKITGGLVAGMSSRDLLVLQNNPLGILEIESRITSQNANPQSLTKSGVGTLLLSNANTLTETTVLNEGLTIVSSDPLTGNVQSNITTNGTTTINGVNTTGLFIGQRVSGTNIHATNTVFINGIGVNSVTVSQATLSGTSNVTFSDAGGLGIKTGANAVLLGAGAALQIGNGGSTGGLVAGQGINNNGTLIFNRSDTGLTFTNDIAGTGAVSQVGTGRTTISGGSANTFSGLTSVVTGQLDLAKPAGTAAVGGNVVIGDGLGGLNADVLRLINANQINDNRSVSLASSGRFDLNGNAEQIASMTMTGGTLTGSGTGLSVSGGVSVTGGGTNRIESVLTASVDITGGATLTLGSTGSIVGPTTINNGTLAGSATSSGGVTINSGGIISPGTSPGALATGAETWNGGGSYFWEINDATGAEGANWDLINITGGLTINATDGNEFTINIAGLTGGNSPGLVPNFDANDPYKWKIVDATALIAYDSSTDSDKFNLAHATNFDNNNPNNGTWLLVRGDESGVGGDNTQLWLTYSPVVVPEPASLGLMASALLLGVRRRRTPRD